MVVRESELDISMKPLVRCERPTLSQSGRCVVIVAWNIQYTIYSYREWLAPHTSPDNHRGRVGAKGDCVVGLLLSGGVCTLTVDAESKICRSDRDLDAMKMACL